MTFADTSGLYALLDKHDPSHERASRAFERFRAEDARLVTHTHVIAEVVALVQRRLGLAVVRRFVDALVPILEVVVVDAGLHAEAIVALVAADRRDVSLVDHTSVLFMRRHGIRQAFTFDADFADEGFEPIPA